MALLFAVCFAAKNMLRFKPTITWILGLLLWTPARAGYGDPMFLAERSATSLQFADTRPYNMPVLENMGDVSSQRKDVLRDYVDYMKGIAQQIVDSTSEEEKINLLQAGYEKFDQFAQLHMYDLKRLLIALDQALLAMINLKLNKKMDSAESKIRATNAQIPYGLYTSPEFKCMGVSYFVVSAHNQEDAQMILSSERKPHCYQFRGAFAFTGFYHRRNDMTYVGPHGEIFPANNPNQGLHCHTPDVGATMQCIYKINPREEFPESVEFEPKVSYFCGPYRYFLPTTTDIRCIFSLFSMNFVLRFAYDGVQYKHSDLSFMYANGQVLYTDEPWAGLSCWNFACKWRHNQNSRYSSMFVN